MTASKAEPIAQTIRILLVEDLLVMRAGLRLLLESDPKLKVVGEASTCGEALNLIKRVQPDIILLELHLEEGYALDFLPDLLAVAHQSRVIVLTGSRQSEDYQRAIALGAKGLVLKKQAPETLLRAIEQVHDGVVWFDHSLLSNVLAAMSQPNGASPKVTGEAAKITLLSAREREVVTLIGERLRNKQIAARLFISEATVRHHLTSIFSKLGLANRLELIIYAYHHGLATPPHS